MDCEEQRKAQNELIASVPLNGTGAYRKSGHNVRMCKWNETCDGKIGHQWASDLALSGRFVIVLRENETNHISTLRGGYVKKAGIKPSRVEGKASLYNSDELSNEPPLDSDRKNVNLLLSYQAGSAQIGEMTLELGFGGKNNNFIFFDISKIK